MLNNKFVLVGVGIGIAVVAILLLRSDANERIIEDVAPRAVAGDITIVAFGDSLTAGYGLPANEAYPAKLETALRAQGASVRVINAGVSGETTRGSLERAAFIRAQNPDIVLLGIGGNDALRQLSLEEAKANITETIKILQGGANPPAVLLLRMQAPINAGLSYKQTFDAMYSNIAETEEVILIPFLTAEVFLDSTNKLPDGIHLNAKGYQTVVEQYMLPVVVPLVEQMEGE
jgi:acyl-CoA thioesterase I